MFDDPTLTQGTTAIHSALIGLSVYGLLYGLYEKASQPINGLRSLCPKASAPD